MKYARLGSSGLQVSRLCLGCMSFGDPSRERAWALDEPEARPVIAAALDHGINFFDTANVYSGGTSEEIVGRVLLGSVPREELVIATKVYGEMRPGPNGNGLSRKAILHEIDASLRRLGTDHVDLYQIHRFDPETPIEETLVALDEVVRSGKARYIGASSMRAWQFMKMLGMQERLGLTRFVSMQDHLNLLHREEEREMLPLCLEDGIGVIPWSPLARGLLAGNRGRGDDKRTTRAQTDAFNEVLYDDTDADFAVVDRLLEVAGERGLPPAQVALAWLLHKPGVTAPIVGATKPGHLEDALAATDVVLSPADIARLEEPYVPHAVSGIF
jgi:aryl-alcohol dehydrogenase-like predicted oxidoreductase